ncbi:MAG: TonB-dependent receptor [Melioribacteraceae bacterium]|nr:TonB-dependent receptor [Melioribacteraceae bacterium]
MKFLRFMSLIFFIALELQAQTGTIRGKVVDVLTKEPLPGVNIIVLDTDFGAASNIEGEYSIPNVPVGLYRVQASFIGYKQQIRTDIVVNSARPAVVNFELQESAIELEGVTVATDYFEKSPTELGNITALSYEEIRRSPGGFEDVVRALSILPGVAQAAAGRNDLVVRGGAPSENLYLVDDFVVPNINHFGTQGATGGALSYINLDFVNNTTFSTGGFSTIYGDKLSSVLAIKLREGRKDRFGGKGTISATQFGLNLEGPVTEGSSFLFSIRRSYLDFIFNAAGFNFVPEYYDALLKYDYKIDNKNRISYLFVGALDRVKFNNENEEDIFDNAQILGSNQNQYVTGVSYRHLFDKGFYTLSLSRNYIKYESFQNDTLLQPLFVNNSKEAEHELKFNSIFKIYKESEFSLGFSAKHIDFESDLYLSNYVTTFGDSLLLNSLSARKNYYKLGAFTQFSTLFFDRLNVSVGVRGDYFNALETKFYASPRISLSLPLSASLSLNLSSGFYHQFPSYIWLNTFESNTKLKAVKVIQYIAGFEHILRSDLRFKLEAFYKDYSNYPASTLREYLVLANTGAGYGGSPTNFDSFGLDPLVSEGVGEARGIEFSAQKRSSDVPHYALFSLTYSESKFKGLDGIERNGAYDQRWIVNLSGGYIFNERWEASFKFRFATGSPYTPYNEDGTQSIEKYNTMRYPDSHSLDIRIDRRWNFERWTLIAYIDVQNIYNRSNPSTINWDYKEMKSDIESSIGILPSIGVSIEF